MDRKISIILAGLGGQGIVTATNLLGHAAINANVNAYASESYGIAQRGCPVICTVRMGNVFGPFLATGTADAIVCTEPLEVLRYIHYANKKTKIITDVTPVVPFTVSVGLETYPDIEDVFREIKRYANLYTFDALKIAKNVGADPISKNIVMLGALAASNVLPFASNILLETILDTVPQNYKETNKKAFEEGFKTFQTYKPIKVKRWNK
jgi:indolepyruvate ferredoxin oxidoreductase beta subunit